MILIAVEKPSVDARLGVSLDEHEGQVLVVRVSPSGLFAPTKLAVGMEIVMVNDMLCEGIKQVSRAMRHAPAGPLKLQVIAPQSVAPQPRRSPPVSRVTSRDSSEDVAPGAVEILLNPERTKPMTKRTSSSASRSSSGSSALPKRKFTIVVPHVPRLGLRLLQDNHRVVVRRIDPESVFSDTDLRVGMRIMAVNDYDCSACNVEQVSQLFRQPPRNDGVLTLTVQEKSSKHQYKPKEQIREEAPESDRAALQEAEMNVVPDDLHERFQRYKSARTTQQQQQPPRKKKTVPMIRATVVKQRANQPTGVRLKESPDRRHVRIAIIQPGSPFQRTSLRVGMTVRLINGIDCAGLTVQQVAQLVRETTGTLTLEATPSSSEPRA